MNLLRSSASRAWRLFVSVLCLSGLSNGTARADFGDPPRLATLVIHSGSGEIGYVNAPLNPAFSSEVFEYSLEIPFEHSDIQIIEATPVEDPLGFHSSEVGTIPPLEAGATTSFTVSVVDDPIAPFAVTTYTIHVTRALPSDDAALADLVLSNATLSPMFGPGELSYEAWVPNEISSLTVTPTAVTPESSIEVNGFPIPLGATSPPIDLAEGETRILIVVTSVDQPITKTYTVDVTRLAADQDSDHDGLPDSYENAHGLEVGIDDTTFDLDGDGLCNICEYAFGSAPDDPGDAAFPSASRDENGFLTISFHRAIDPSEGLRFRVEVSSDLLTWQRDVTDETDPATPESQVWRDFNGGAATSPPARFIRVRVIAAAP